jgi:hypothetical protein
VRILFAKDLTQFFENVFNRADAIKTQQSPQQPPQSPYSQFQKSQQYYPEPIDLSPRMTPEQRGAARRKQQLQAERDWLTFLKTITQDEYDALVELSKGNICIPNKQLEKMGEQGISLDLDRLEKAEAVKRETIPGEDFTEFRICAIGRRILEELA